MPQYIAGARGNRDSGIFSSDSPWAAPDKQAAPKGGDFLDRLAEAEARDDYATGAQEEQERMYQMALRQQMMEERQQAQMQQQLMRQQQQAKHERQVQQQQMMIAARQQQQQRQQQEQMMMTQMQRQQMIQQQQMQQQQQQQHQQMMMHRRASSPRPADKPPTPRAKKSSMADHLYGSDGWAADQPSPRNSRPVSRQRNSNGTPLRGRESPRANVNAPAAGGFVRKTVDGHRDVSPPRSEAERHGGRSSIALGSTAWDGSAISARGRTPLNGRGMSASTRRGPGADADYAPGSQAALRARQKQGRAFTPDRRAPSPRANMPYDDQRSAGAGRAHTQGAMRGAHLQTNFAFG